MVDVKVATVRGGGETVERLVTQPSNAPKENSVVMHGRVVRDPYLWLMDSDALRVKQWQTKQTNYTRALLDEGPVREDIVRRLEELESGPEVGAPISARIELPSGKCRYFQFRQMPGEEYRVLYYMDGLDGEPKVVLDPNKFSRDKKTALVDWFPSDDGTVIAFTTSEHNNDIATLKVINVETGRVLKDTIEDITFADVAWLGNEGFYYSRWPNPRDHPDPKRFNHVYYHRLGTSPERDTAVFGAGLGAEKVCSVHIDTNDHYLFIHVLDNVNNDVYYKNLHPNASPDIKVLVQGKETEFYVMDVWDGRAYALTSHNAPNYKVVSFNIENSSERGWRTVIPERDVPIADISYYGQKLMVKYGRDTFSELRVFTIGGKLLSNVDLPMRGFCTTPYFAKEHGEATKAIFEMSSPVHQKEAYEFDYRDFVVRKFSQKSAPKSSRINMRDYEFRQVMCISHDGMEFPMLIINKKGIKRDGNNPVVLYGYGGFNSPIEPEFDHRILPFLEDGGVWCEASIRGGGEYGRDWYFGGIGVNRQNGFNDFISAAEWLIKNNYTNPDRLAIRGRSNGGFLVAGVREQRPDLFRAVVAEMPEVNLLNDKSNMTPLFRQENGDPRDPLQFASIMTFEPYRNIKKGDNHSSLLVVGGEYDTRCEPGDARVYAAAAQDALALDINSEGSDTKVLLLMQKDIGHGGVIFPIRKSQQLEWTADWLTFIYKELGMEEVVAKRQLEQLKRAR